MNTTDTGRSVLAGLFHNGAEAEMALAELKSAGYTRAEISEVDSDANDDRTADTGMADSAYAPATMATGTATTGGSFFREHEAHASSFIDELLALNFSKSDARHLVDSIVRGEALVTVDGGALGVAGARQILERHAAKVYVAQGADAEAGYPAESPAATAVVPPVAARTGATETDDREIQLREERLAIDKRRVQHGEARLSKRVVTETQTIEVPVTHEELVIERTAMTDRTASGAIGHDEEIVIPLSTEVVNVEKRVVATEEVTIGKREVAGVEHVAETVRHEELVVDDATIDAANAKRL